MGEVTVGIKLRSKQLLMLSYVKKILWEHNFVRAPIGIRVILNAAYFVLAINLQNCCGCDQEPFLRKYNKLNPNLRP